VEESDPVSLCQLMKSGSRILLALLLMLGGPCSARAKPLQLVQNGKSEYAILLPVKALPCVRLAGEELRRCVKVSSGAELAIVEEKEALPCKAILLGGAGGAFGKYPAETGRLANEGFFIKRVGEAVYIAGLDSAHDPMQVLVGAPYGTLFGVYEFLEPQRSPDAGAEQLFSSTPWTTWPGPAVWTGRKWSCAVAATALIQSFRSWLASGCVVRN
jgi:hypothetical protein